MIQFPIYLYDGDPIDQEGSYYVIAGNGIFLRKDNGSSVSLVPVDTISCLPDLKTTAFLKWKLPKIPKEITFKVKQLFEEVYDLYKAEANVVLYYDFKNLQWLVKVPSQKVKKRSVKYSLEPSPSSDLRRVATIHSHGNSFAFHSPEDVKDEEYFDGLHCTFGDIKQKVFSISASIVTNGYRENIDPLLVFDGIQESVSPSKITACKYVELQEIPPKYNLDEWLKNIEGN